MADLDIGGAFSPDGIASAAERVAAAVRVLSQEEFGADGVPGDFEADWDSFTQEWVAWKSAHTSWLSRSWNTTRDELTTFVERYNTLRGRWAELHSATAAEGFTVQSDSLNGAIERLGSSLGVALKDVGVGLGVLVGVALVGYLAWKVA